MQKSMPKKYWKLMPKGSQNDAKMDAQIHDFLSFFKKDEIYEIKPPLGREHEFTGSGHLNCRENRYKRHTKSLLGKGMQKVWKIMLKWIQNGNPNPSKSRLGLSKIYVRSIQNPSKIEARSIKILSNSRPRGIKIEVRSRPGGIWGIYWVSWVPERVLRAVSWPKNNQHSPNLGSKMEAKSFKNQ